MILTRRELLSGLATSAVTPALAQTTWPNRPVILVVGFPAGGPVDTVSRILAEGLSGRFGQQVLVDNRPGATGTTAAVQVARAAPDGHTLLALPGTFAANAAMFRKLPYRSLEDFAMISMTTEFPYVLVTYADHSIRSPSDLINVSRSQSTPLQYGTAGTGSLQHLSMELFANMAKIKLQHIPYRGGAPAITDLLGKRIDFVLDPPTALIEFIRDGRMRALAVTGPTRFFSLPEVPTVGESAVPGYSVTSWQGLAAPAGLPAALLSRLNADVAAVLADTRTADKLKTLGTAPRPSSPDEFKSRVASDIETWTKVVEVANIERI